LYDSERGSGSHLRIGQYEASNHGVTYNVDFRNDGVQIGSNGSINYSGSTYIGWSFAKNPGFFDVVTYDGDSNTGRQIPHNLGTTPGMMIVKCISSDSYFDTSWAVYHKSLPNTQILKLNTSDGSVDSNHFHNTTPTDQVFTVGSGLWVNSSLGNRSYVAYLFADNPSNGIKCGTFSNNTGSWGPPAPADAVVDCGFAPQFIIAKNIEQGGWYIMDSERGWSTSGDHQVAYRNASVQAQENNAEVTEGNFNFNATSTGFEVTYSRPGTWVFIAIGSPTALSSIPTGTLASDADPSTNTAIVEASSWPIGDSVSGTSLSASLTSILEVSGNTIFGNGPTGTWMSGYYAEGSQINDAPPGPSEITFTSQNQGTPAFSGVDATLTSRTWTLESGATATGPWTVVDTYEDYDVLNSQTGATPWTSNKPNLSPNTFYRIKVQYDSTNAESVESVYNTFKTGDA